MDIFNDIVSPIPSDKEWAPEKLQKLDFEDGSELISFYDEHINSGRVILHPWQVEVNEFLAKEPANDKHPLKYALRAANGSGKDAYVVAPFALWFVLCNISSRVIITSSSGTQLTAQTETYITNLSNKINAFHFANYGAKILKINQRHIRCLLSGSEIRLFATDEEGRAEGYHPLEPGAKMAIVVNEAKSVSTDIFRALRRCTGYSHWLNVSTPGLIPAGDFYKSCIYGMKSMSGWYHRKVTYFDCPHQSPDEYEADKRDLGEHSALFRSKWLAEFTTVDGDTIIPANSLENLRYKIREGKAVLLCQHWPIRIGLDLSTSGDETVISAWRGNQQVFQQAWREKDTTVTVSKLCEIFESELKIPKDHAYIYADDGGVGRAIIDQLRQKGYINIRRILNQSAASNKTMYRNKGAELWYNFRRLVETGIVCPNPEDDKLWEQLGTRRYKKIEEEAIVRVQLESKAAAKAEGLPSPDRADAAVLAFTGLTYNSFYNEEEKVEVKKQKIASKRYSGDAAAAHLDDIAFGNVKEDAESKRFKGSISVLLKRNRSTYGNRFRTN